MENSQVVKVLDALKQRRSNIESKWADIDRLILPLNQGSFAQSASTENAKDWSTLDVWDSTAPIGADRLASMLFSMLTSGRWFGVNFDRAKLNKETKFRRWLDDQVDTMFDAVMASNFEVEMASLALEWVGYGNGAISHSLVSEEKWEGMDFAAWPVKEFFFEPDWRGRVHRAFRPLNWYASKIVSKFRDPTDPTKPSPKIPEKILKAYESGSDETFEVIFTIYPRDGKAPLAYGETVRAPLERPFGWKYVLREGQVTLDEGGFFEMPVYLAQWQRPADSMWGYGPALLTLPSVKLLNVLQETEVNAGEKAVDPPVITTERGLMSDLNNVPGGLITVRSLDDIDTFESKARFDVSELLLDRHAAMVRKHFREDDISMKDGMMTATEVNRRTVVFNRQFGPPGKRMLWGVFGPMVQTTFNMMMRMGELEPVPEELLKQKPRFRIVFYNPLLTAQRDDETSNLERALAAKAAMVKMDPGSPAKHVIKDDVAMRELAERLSLPAAMVASDDEVKAAVEQEQKLRTAAQQAQIAKTAAEADRAQAGAEQLAQEVGGA